MTPDSATQLAKLGHTCVIEAGAGAKAGFSDAAYAAAGVEVLTTAKAVIEAADVIVKVRGSRGRWTCQVQGRPDPHQLLLAGPEPRTAGGGCEEKPDCRRHGHGSAHQPAPRRWDALSSMANIAGYRAVIEAGSNFGRFFTGRSRRRARCPRPRCLSSGRRRRSGGHRNLGFAWCHRHAFDVRPEVAEQIESMGASFVFLEFEASQDGAATGGYAAPSSPEFREKQLAKFRELAPEMDIVITTALIPGRPAPKLWTEDMVKLMKPGSVIVDLAAERGGNCDLTVPDQKIVTDNGVTIVGYTDFPSRMAAQASTLYSTNIRHMLTDLTPKKDGVILHNMEDDVIRGATVAHVGAVTYPPPPPKIAAIAAAKPKPKAVELTPAERRAQEVAAFKAQTRNQVGLLAVGGGLILLAGLYTPASFMQHFVVFVLAVFVGFQVIWNVSHSLHTPLMAITNAISSIIILGALMQIGSGNWLVVILAALSVFMAGINIFGGFMVTRRMLAMFQKS
jgi:H+-translocating NAD(P) transhydrogenase subunit alpha